MKHNDSLSGATETLFFVLALAAIGASLGLLAGNYSPQSLVGFALGGFAGMIVGAVLALIASRWGPARRKDQQTPEEQRAISIPIITADPYLHDTRLSITEVYTDDTIPVQIALLVTYENPYPHASHLSAAETTSSDPTPADISGLDPATAEDVIRSLATTAARRFTLTKSIDALVTPETFDTMGQVIVDEMNQSLAHWRLKAHLVNVEEIKLPEKVVADQMAVYNRELSAETDRRIEAASVEALHKELQVLKHVVEDSYERAKEAGLSRKLRSRYVFRELLAEIKDQTSADGTWSPSLDELLSSLDDVPALADDLVEGSAG